MGETTPLDLDLNLPFYLFPRDQKLVGLSKLHQMNLVEFGSAKSVLRVSLRDLLGGHLSTLVLESGLPWSDYAAAHIIEAYLTVLLLILIRAGVVIA